MFVSYRWKRSRALEMFGYVGEKTNLPRRVSHLQPEETGGSFIASTMVQRFFSMRQTDQQNHQTTLIMLLSGPPSCGKTSLLFQFAFNEAQNSNGIVIFICSRRRLEANPPHLSQGVDSSCETFQRVIMKYVDDDEGIKKFFAAFHLYDEYPVSVVIDDFGDFFEERSCQQRYGNPRGRDLAMVRTLALCHNAMLHANETRPCQLLLSDTHHGESPRLLFIYKRWVSTIFTIQGDGSGSFLLKDFNHSASGTSRKRKTARYSIALQYLVLEEIVEDGA